MPSHRGADISFLDEKAPGARSSKEGVRFGRQPIMGPGLAVGAFDTRSMASGAREARVRVLSRRFLAEPENGVVSAVRACQARRRVVGFGRELVPLRSVTLGVVRSG
jgi:hypothetical protein